MACSCRCVRTMAGGTRQFRRNIRVWRTCCFLRSLYEHEESKVDKYEFKISLNEINNLIAERRFEEAAQIADGIDWNHVKSTDTLCRVSEVYKVIGDYDKSRDVMAIARERDNGNPAILYALCELTIFLYGRDGLQSDLTLALQLMQEFKAVEPNNPKRLVLQYKMYGVSPVSEQEKIAVLEQLKAEKFMPRWVYELARLYAAAGDSARAAAACREVIKNKPGSMYAEKAETILGELNTAAKTTAASERAGHPAEESVAEASYQGEIPVAEGAEAEQESLQENTEENPGKDITSGAAGEDAAVPEKVDAQSIEPAQEPAAESAELPIRTPEEQHHVDSIQRSIAKEMQDIYARPYDDKLEQETNGQYSMVMETPAEPEQQVEGQISISEVMAEWEKIRADIRKANDEKRAQRILEDTGALIHDFDETARHGLLEDIEKGVARQRRQVRSGAYRMGENLPPQAPAGREATRGPRPVRRDEYDNAPQNRPVRRRPAGDALAADAGIAAGVAAGAAAGYAAARGSKMAEDRPARRPQAASQEPVRRPQRRPVPVSNEDDDVKVYGRKNDVEELATRRWNSEEIHRAMARQEQLAREEEETNARERAHLQEDYPENETAGEQRAARGENDRLEPTYFDEPDAEEGFEEVIPEDAPVNDSKRLSEPKEVGETPTESEGNEESAADEEYQEESLEETAEADETEKEEAVEDKAEELYDAAPEDETYEQESEESEEPEEEEYEEAPEEESEEPSAAASPEEEFSEAAPEESGELETEEPEPDSEEKEEEPAEPEPRRRAPRQPAQQKAAQQAAGHKGGKRQLTREERRLFGPFCRMRENVDQLTEALDQISLASSTGNVLIIGNDATADRVAKGILEVTRHTDSNFTGKIAKVTGDALNRLSAEGFAKTFEKLSNGALIVSKATEISPKGMERLYHELEGKEHGLILIMTDGNKKMEQFRHENERYLGSFTAVISIRPLNDKALVAYAKDYAMSQDYSIDEFGQLALAQRIAMMQTSTHQVTLKEVRDLVDEAISYASRKTPHTLLDVMAKRRYDENDRIIIHEKDFMHS